LATDGANKATAEATKAALEKVENDEELRDSQRSLLVETAKQGISEIAKLNKNVGIAEEKIGQLDNQVLSTEIEYQKVQRLLEDTKKTLDEFHKEEQRKEILTLLRGLLEVTNNSHIDSASTASSAQSLKNILSAVARLGEQLGAISAETGRLNARELVIRDGNDNPRIRLFVGGKNLAVVHILDAKGSPVTRMEGAADGIGSIGLSPPAMEYKYGASIELQGGRPTVVVRDPTGAGAPAFLRVP
jgi:hypothetical protein